MTEQEKKNKVVEDIIQIIKKVYDEWGMYIPSKCGGAIYDYILHREEEVKKEMENEIFSRIYDEIRMNFRKSSEITGRELLEFIQHVEFQMLKEAKASV